MAEENQRELHVVMFPWFARGHITPFLEFATRLANHGIKISFVSTPLNIKRIKEQLILARIHPVELAMPSVEGLPPGVESTADAKGERAALLIPLLFRALDILKKPFEELLRQLSTDYVIHDVMQCWIPLLAANLAIPTIVFFVLGIASMSFSEGQTANGLQSPTPEDLTGTLPGFPSTIVRHRMFEARKFMALHQKNEEGMSVMDRLSMSFRESRAIACNTCLELEGVYVEYLQSLTGRPVLPVGILMPNLPPRLGADFCLEWLDRQSATSVVFVSFGTECTLTNEETTALAMSLEDSTASFLWVMPASNTAAALPQQGFKHRIREKGLVLTQWAPQLHTLNHLSIGAFITHCGWSSFTEGLRFGVPLITLSMQFVHGLNAKLAKELKVGVEVRRNEDDGSITRNDISKAIRSVMCWC